MKAHFFRHPKALPHPLTTTPRDFVMYTSAYEPKYKKKKVFPFTKPSHIQIIFLCLLSLYKMEPLSVKKSFQLFPLEQV